MHRYDSYVKPVSASTVMVRPEIPISPDVVNGVSPVSVGLPILSKRKLPLLGVAAGTGALTKVALSKCRVIYIRQRHPPGNLRLPWG